MNFSIEQGYSSLHNYLYSGKGRLITLLDNLSTPSRQILGGRTVHVATQTVSSVKRRNLITFIFHLVIFPVSSLFLLFKLSTMPWKWEAKIVQEKSQEALKLVQIFKEHIQNKKLLVAIAHFNKHPEIYEMTKKETEATLRGLINENESWDKLSCALSKMPADLATKLIVEAVHTKLRYEKDSGQYLTDPKLLIQLISKGLNKDAVNIRACYLDLLSKNGPLHINTNDDLDYNAAKMDLADALLQSFKGTVKEKEKFVRDLRLSLLTPEEKHYKVYLNLFVDPLQMSEITESLRSRRNLKTLCRIAFQEFGTKVLNKNEKYDLFQLGILLKNSLLKLAEALDHIKRTAIGIKPEYLDSLLAVFKKLFSERNFEKSQFQSISQDLQAALNAYEERLQNHPVVHDTLKNCILTTISKNKFNDFKISLRQLNTFLTMIINSK